MIKLKELLKEGIFSSWMVDKAIKISNKMSGNMTGAVKAIEKLKKGLSKDKKVADALRQANESVNEAKELDQKSIDFIAKLTHHNNHTRSRLELAQHMRDKRLIRAYQGIIYVQDLLGDANDISKARLRLDKQLWYKAKKMYSNFDDIYKAY